MQKSFDIPNEFFNITSLRLNGVQSNGHITFALWWVVA